jgi:Ca2+-binding EF-hand superfamily protein
MRASRELLPELLRFVAQLYSNSACVPRAEVWNTPAESLDHMRPSSPTERARTAIINESRDAARRFADSDVDGDQTLSFAQFYDMQPPGLREKFPESTFQAWFDSADLNRSGVLTIDQVFLWTLENACVKHGEDAMRTLFTRYDPDRSGVLDAFEFEKVCDDLGFGLASHTIFRALDPDASGSVSYSELMTALHDDGAPLSAEMEKQIKSIIVSAVSETKTQTQKVFDIKGWVVMGETAKELKEQMRKLLLESGAHVVRLRLRYETSLQYFCPCLPDAACDRASAPACRSTSSRNSTSMRQATCTSMRWSFTTRFASTSASEAAWQ